MKTTKTLMITFLAVLAMFGMISTASADLYLDPGVAIYWGNQTATSQIIVAINDYSTSDPYPLVELYKQDYAEGSSSAKESGPAAPYYDTLNMTSSGGEITWGGSAYIEDALYLLVKDGKHNPSWYLFDLTSWHGKEKIILSDFWLTGGGISHVAIYGGQVQVPEPMTLLLLGLGLVGVAGVGRKLRK